MQRIFASGKAPDNKLDAKLTARTTDKVGKQGEEATRLDTPVGQRADPSGATLPFEPRKSSPLPTVPKYKSSGTKPSPPRATAPEIEDVPDEEAGTAPLPRDPLQPAPAPDAFIAPRDPEFRNQPPPGGKAEPALPEKTKATAMFREAIAAAARLYAGLAEDARRAVAAANASEGRLDSKGRLELEAGLATLAEGLRSARQTFDSAANAAASLVDQRAREARRQIQKISQSAYGTLNATRAAADVAFKKHEDSRTEREKAADSSIARVKSAGTAASEAITSLNRDRETVFLTTGAPMPSAVNEGINIRLPEKAEPSAATYTEEADLEVASLTKVFDSMKAGLKDQFDQCADEMAKIAKSSSASITSARDSAYEHLAQTVNDLHDSIAAARARGHAALVRQYNLSRRQLISAHQDRARNESEASQQRALRSGSNAVAAANGQVRGAQSLGDNLARENQRPAADFARIVSNSASAMVRHIAETGRKQQESARESMANGESAALRQSVVTSDRLAHSAETAAQQLNEAGNHAGKALTDQIETAVASFDEMPEPVRRAFASVLPSAKSGYDLQNAQAADKLALAEATIKGAMAGEGGGKEGGKASGQGEAETTRSPAEKPNEFIARAGKIAKKPSDDALIAELISTADLEIPKKIRGKVGPIYNELVAFSTNIENVMAQLRGMTGLQGNALKEVYKNEQGEDLVAQLSKELRKTFSTGTTDDLNVSAALNYLAGDNVKAALAELQATVNWTNDEGRAERVQRSLTPAQLDKLNSQNPDAMKEISKDLDGTDKLVFDALNKIKPVEGLKGKAREAQEAINYAALGEANAYGLKKTIDDAREKRGEGGGDLVVDRITNARQSIGSDILSGGDAVSSAFEDADIVQQRQEKLWTATEKGFEKVVTKLPDGSRNVAKPNEAKPLSAIARYAAAPRKYAANRPGDSRRKPGARQGGRTQDNRVSEGLDPRQTQLIDDIVKYGPNSEEAAASTIEFELNRKESKPKEDRLRRALLGEDLLAARENESDAARENRLNDLKDASGNVIRQGDRAKVEARRKNILAKVAERQAANAQTSGTSPPKIMNASQVEAALVGRLEERFSGDPTAKAYTKSMITSSTFEPDPEAAFDFALAHEDKNKETLIATLGRMNRTQITDAVKRWDKAQPERVPLYQQLGLYGNKSGKLDGDARNDVEQAFRGVARNDKERALNAIFAVEQQRRDSGAAGRSLAEADYNRMVAKQDKLLAQTGLSRDDIDETGDIKLKGKDGNPITGKFEPDGSLKLEKGARDEFEAALQFSHMHADTYKQAVDRIASGVVMGLMVLAAVITTFVTFGGAAAIWGPILITAGAGLVGMGMTAAIRGDRYTKAEIQRDLVMTFVQAATAGLGAWAGAGARGAGTAAKGAQAAVKGAATSEKLAAQVAATAGKQSLSRGAKALEFGKDVIVGGTTNAINSSVGAAMDPENRRLGKSGEKAWDSGIASFAGGALGAALTKPFAALGKPLGAGSQRVMGNVGSGFTSRLTEARMTHVAGEAHQSWGESLEIAKEGIAQDAIQAVGEHGADRAAHFRAARALNKKRAAERAQAGKDNALPTTQARSTQRDRPPPPPEAPLPVAAADTAEAPVRAAAVRDALPPELKPVVEASVAPEVRPDPPPQISPDVPVAPPAVAAEPTPIAAPAREGPADVDVVQPPTPAKGDRPGHSENGADTVLALEKSPLGPPVPENDNGDRTSVAAQALETVPLGALTPANDNGDNAKPPDPILARVALQKSGALDGGAIPNHSVFVHPDAGDLMAANDNFGSLILKDPTREVSHIYNLDTGESIVIQGESHRTGTINAEGKQTGKGVPLAYGWTRLMNGKSGGRWVLRSHFHPNKPGSAATALTNRLPSGHKGDFHVLLNELIAHGLTSRSSRIYYIDNGHFKYTDFGVDANSVDGRYWMEYPDPVTGKRVREHFPTLRDYHTYVGVIMGERYDIPAWHVEPDLKGIIAHVGASRAPVDGDQAHMITIDQDHPDSPDMPEEQGERQKIETPAKSGDRISVQNSATPTKAPARPPAPLPPVRNHGLPKFGLVSPDTTATLPHPPGALAPGSTSASLTNADVRNLNAVSDSLSAGNHGAAHHMLSLMGLVGQPDSMIRLRTVINDKQLTVSQREALAEAVRDATWQQMYKDGTIKADEPLHLLFHGAPEARARSLIAIGMNFAKLGRGVIDDFSKGLYTSHQLINGLIYSRRNSPVGGLVFPFLVKHTDLGTVIDLTQYSDLHDKWIKFNIDRMDQYEGYSKKIKDNVGSEFHDKKDFFTDYPDRYRHLGFREFILKSTSFFGKRGVVFDDFLATLEPDLKKPDIVFGDLGGPFTSGIGYGDQQAIKRQRLANLLNRQLGIMQPYDDNDDDLMAHMIEPSSTSSLPPAPVAASAKTARAGRKKKTALATASDDTTADTSPDKRSSAQPTKAQPRQRRRSVSAAEVPVATTDPAAASTGEASPSAGEGTAATPTGGKRNRDQGKRVLDGEAAHSRARELEQEKARELLLKNEVADAKALVNRRSRADPAELGPAPDATPEAAAIMRKLQMQLDQQASRNRGRVTQEDRLEALQEFLANEGGGLDPATRRRLEWIKKNLESIAVVERAEKLVAESDDKIADADIKTKEAEKAKREANRPVKSLMRKTGPNYRRIKRTAKHDAILGEARFAAQQKAALATRGGKPIGLSPDHLIPLDEIANMPQLLPIFEIHARASPALKAEIVQVLRDLGDLPDNLIPMRSDANSIMKKHYSWHDIDPADAAAYGYTPDDVRIMREREDKMRAEILKHIGEITKKFQAKLAAETEERSRALRNAPDSGE